MARFRRRRSAGLVPLRDVAGSGARREDVGGKAIGLARALDLGLPVPETWVLPATAFRNVVRSELPPGHDPHSLIRVIERPVGLERSAAARELLLKVPIDAEIETALGALWDEISDAPWGVAVRSSASCEDDAVASMAGLAETVLGVRSRDELLEAVRRVWASGVRGDSLRYLRSRRIKDVAMAVVFQRVVRARAAGVLFTHDPVPPLSATGAPLRVEGDRPSSKERVVSAAFGLGSPVVEGLVCPDTFRLNDEGVVTDRRTAVKTGKLVIGREGLETVSVPPEEADRPSLDETDFAALADVARRLDEEGEGPCEVEFAVQADGPLQVLQLRKSVGAGYPEGGDATTVWSRAGLGEALSGVVTPLTWSMFEAFSEQGFRRSFAALGSKVPRGTKLVGRVHGRFYFNLSAFMQAAAEVPGLDPRTLLELSHGEGIELLHRQIDARRAKRSLTRLPLTAARLLTEQGRLSDEVKRFERDAEQFHRWLAEMDLGILPDDSLKTTLREVRDFFERTANLTLSAASASLAAHLGLKTVLARSTPVAAERVAQAITSGVGDLESAKPGIALAHVIAIARRDPDAARALAAGEVTTLEDLASGPARRAITHFLDAYGDHALREAELSTPRWSEDPCTLLEMIAAGLHCDSLDPDARLSRVRAVADRELAAVEERLPYVETLLVRALVARLRRFTRLRERMRVWLTHAMAMLRTVALDVDRRLRRLDPSLPRDAAFFCTFDELLEAVVRSRTDLAPLVRLRRAEYERDRRRPDPALTFVGTPPAAEVPPAGAVIHGLPGSGGTVTGAARVVTPYDRAAHRLRPGEVLVSRTTDMALAPLFFVATAVVTEIGSPLSHAAILAREFGLPAVMGAHGVTTVLRDGEPLRVDGDRGVVERLDP